MTAMFGVHWNEREVLAPADTAKSILMRVAASHKLSLRRLKSRTRYREVVYPRQQAMWTIRTALGWSYPRIAMLFNMDHTTVMHGVQAYEKRMGEGG